MIDEAKALPRDSVLRAVAVQKRLTKLLGLTSPGIDTPSLMSGPPRAWHYAYFPSPGSARKAAERLREQGYPGEVTEAGERWLVLVAHDLPAGDGSLRAADAAISRVVEAEGGEYDGWERERLAGHGQ